MSHLLRVFVLLLIAAPTLAQGMGRIEGRVVKGDRGLGGVTVVVQEAAAAEITNSSGYFTLGELAPGSYTLVFTLGGNSVVSPGIEVVAGEKTEIVQEVDWNVSRAESITVYSASRRAERIVEAPQAVTTVTEEQIEEQASHGQVPKLLEFTPGAEVTQSGVYDYNFNTRGFNSSLNRRVATLIDGRNPAVPFLGAQEWAAVSFPLDDLASVELVRGPSAALYGANASSGVLNMTTKQPRYSEGGLARYSGGDLGTNNFDMRHADQLVDRWYYKVTAGLRKSGDFSRSRTPSTGVEYSEPCTATGQTDCLPLEVPLARTDDNEIWFGSARMDRYFDNGGFLTFEAGTAYIQGPLFQTGIGRVQLIDVQRPWARINYTGKDWNLLAYTNKRDAPTQRALSSGANLALDTDNLTLEGQKRFALAGDRVQFTLGASHTEEDIDTFDPQTGRQSLVFAPIEADRQAVYGQADFKITDKLRFVAAGRYDESTLHDSQFSPKASIVITPRPNHSIRLTYNEAFQVANYSEFFLQADVAAPVDLSGVEAICTAENVDCGFGGPTRVLALGNESLELEEISTAEIGYTGIFGNKLFVTVDVYASENENFITDLIANINPDGSRNNPNFQAYVAPAGLSAMGEATLLATLQGALGPTFFALTNNLDGTPIIGARTYSNFGSVDTEGADLGIRYYFSDAWNLDANYSIFDFELDDPNATNANQLTPNTPENKAAVGISYSGERLSGSLSGRWVDDFRWVVGPFQGDVESYTTIDLNANYQIDESWTFGIAVANLLDDEHYQSFGGDLLARRALANVTYRWK